LSLLFYRNKESYIEDGIVLLSLLTIPNQ